MTKYFTNNLSVINLYKKPSKKSEVVTQMIFGESFSISKETKNWLRVKIKKDGYKGFIQNKKFSKFLKPTHKIHVLKAKVYKFPNKRKKLNEHYFEAMDSSGLIHHAKHKTGVDIWAFKMKDFYNTVKPFFISDIYNYLEHEPTIRPYQD